MTFDKSARVYTRALLSSSTLPTRFRQVTHRFGASEPDAKAYAVCLLAAEGPLSKPITAAQPWEQELVFMRHTCRSQHPSGSAQLEWKADIRRQHQHRGAKS